MTHEQKRWKSLKFLTITIILSIMIELRTFSFIKMTLIALVLSFIFVALPEYHLQFLSVLIDETYSRVKSSN